MTSAATWDAAVAGVDDDTTAAAPAADWAGEAAAGTVGAGNLLAEPGQHIIFSL